MTRNLHRFFSLPLLPVVASLVAGAVAGGMGDGGYAAVVFCAFFLVLVTGCCLKWTGLSVKVLWAVAGCFLVAFFSVYTRVNPILPGNHVVNFAGRKVWIIEGRILPPLDPGLTRSHITVKVRALLTHEQRRIPVCGKLRLTVYAPYTKTVYAGDLVRFASAISRVPPPANPFTFDYRRFLALRRIYAIARVNCFSQLVVLRNGNRKNWLTTIDRLRQHLNRWIMASVPAPYSALAAAFLIGYRGQVPPAMKEIFVRCGTSHLIAISGLHLGIVSILLFIFIRRILVFFPKIFLYMDVQRITAILTFVLLLFYLALTGGRVSTIRAFIMATAFLAVLFSRRTSRLPDILLLAAFVILFFQPQAVFYVSFQLTFAAVGGILLGVSREPYDHQAVPGGEKAGALEKAARWIGMTLLITLLAVAVTFPIATYHFHRASPIALLANLFGIPFVGFVMLPVGLISLVLYPFSVTLATFLLRIDGFFIKGLVHIFQFFAKFPHSRVYVFPPRWHEIILYYMVFAFTVFAFRSKNRAARRRNILMAVVSMGLLGCSFAVSRGVVQPSVAVFNVKKGTYLAVCQKDGQATLICDGLGESPNRDDAGWVLIPYLLHQRIRKIDAIVIINNDPVNLQAVRHVLDYKRPKFLVGTRSVLYSLKTVPPEKLPRVKWVESSQSLRAGEVEIMFPEGTQNRFHTRETRGVTVSFQKFRLLVLSPGHGKNAIRENHRLKLLVTPSVEKALLQSSDLGRGFWIVRYPAGNFWRGRRTGKRGTLDLRHEGAVMIEKSGEKWHLKTFLGHRVQIMEVSSP